ncbi:hypothetical protein EVJ58_g1307 [Rhodofomes roseus]|uniref:Cytochrome P450 n=1 Tax=Rhodofomes roseus TaxID=34475 RepID=A0A4Y9Z1Q3_9APHY|nr:hypothetical protein EVJ58_g1307 [Rhodofomes roseus]
MTDLFDHKQEAFYHSVATDYGSIVKISGFLGRPMLVVADPKALHHMLIKEEHVYQETKQTNLVYFGPGLLSTLGKELSCLIVGFSHECTGKQHARQRKLLNPVFSVNHMRHMLPLFYDITHKLRDALKSRLQNGPKDVDVHDWMGRTALELVGQGGLGYSFDTLVEDSKDEYGQALKRFAPLVSTVSLVGGVVSPSMKLPKWLRRTIVESFPAGTRIERLKKVVDTMDGNARAIYTAKRCSLEKGDAEVVKQVSAGKDIISVLIRANTTAQEKDRLSEEEIVAQMSTLIFAGMDTTSNTLSRILWILAQNPDVQMKLREELLDANAMESLAYDELNRLPYLDAVCRETMRVYPTVNLLFRVATEDSVLPLSEPLNTRDGKRLTEIPVPKGSDLLIGVLGSNLSRALWGEDAMEWKPERWINGIPAAVSDAHIPGVYSNLGFKFSEMEMKVVLSVLVSTFTFELGEQPIAWNMGGLVFPTVGWESIEPSLPLKLSLYKPAL